MRWKNRIFDNVASCQALLKEGKRPDGSGDEEFAQALIELDHILPEGATVKFSCLPLVQGQNSI
jgi:hypothetical protein